MVPITSMETLYSELLSFDKPLKGAAFGAPFLHQRDREMLQSPAD